jgi:hypothetical protein
MYYIVRRVCYPKDVYWFCICTHVCFGFVETSLLSEMEHPMLGRPTAVAQVCTDSACIPSAAREVARAFDGFGSPGCCTFERLVAQARSGRSPRFCLAVLVAMDDVEDSLKLDATKPKHAPPTKPPSRDALVARKRSIPTCA